MPGISRRGVLEQLCTVDIGARHLEFEEKIGDSELRWVGETLGAMDR